MGSHPAARWGEALVTNHWRDSYRFILLDPTPLRPGRRRSKSQGNRKGYRHESRRREDDFSEVRARVGEGFLNGSLDAIAARQRIDEAGFGEFLRVAESRAELVDACADFAEMGYTLWTVEGDEDPNSALLRLTFVLPADQT